MPANASPAVEQGLDVLLAGLRATAEPTRLRILALCSEAELTVSDLIEVLGQSQPRVSRHLKVLVDAGLLERHREGSWVFHRLPRESGNGALTQRLMELLPRGENPLALDRRRLAEIKNRRATAAADYFQRNAAQWGELRSLHVDDAEVEAALSRHAPDGAESLLDIGTGTGRILEILAPKVAWAQGIDLSRDMLGVARASLDRAGVRNCTVREGDMYRLPLPDDRFDMVTVHQVLHFADAPERVVREAARVLKPGGRLLIVDFSPHDLEYLRNEHEHRRLGFAAGEVRAWLGAAGLSSYTPEHLPGRPLTVTLWRGDKPAAAVPRAVNA